MKDNLHTFLQEKRKMSTNITLTGRLQAVASFISKGARLIDVGTDHAYLPISLLCSGKIECALACDIAEGPIQRAKEHALQFPQIVDKITLLKTDGLKNTEGFHPTDIAICGMGGELISKIISDSHYVKSADIKLILQPMTMEEELRTYLYENGFYIYDECIVLEGQRVYQIICACYDGISREKSSICLLLGEHNLESKNKGIFCLAEKELRSLEKKRSGLVIAGKYDGSLENIISQLRAVISEYEQLF